MKNKLYIIILLPLFTLLGVQSAYAQNEVFENNSFKDAMPVTIKDSTILNMHIIGVKYGYGISNVGFSQDIDHKSINAPFNIGIYYTYYHSLWGYMPYFGLNTGIELTELGYTEIKKEEDVITNQIEHRYKAIDIPLMTQFRVDFWRMRAMLGIGAYGSYITSYSGGDIPETTNKFGCGIVGNFGIGFKFNPLELHLDVGYKYSLSHLLNPQINSTEYWLYTHANQLKISIGLFYNLSTLRKRK